MPAILGLTHCPKLFAATGRSYGHDWHRGPALDLREIFLLPAIAAGVTLLVALPAAQWLHAQNLPLFITLAVEGGGVMLLYLLLIYVTRPRATRERAAYVWTLLRGRDLTGINRT